MQNGIFLFVRVVFTGLFLVSLFSGISSSLQQPRLIPDNTT